MERMPASPGLETAKVSNFQDPPTDVKTLSRPLANVEKLLTYKAIADTLGVPYFKVQRAVRAKLFPTYRVLNGRRLLKLSEVVAVIDSTREGGE